MEMSREELGLNCHTDISAVSYSANYVSTLNFSFLTFEKDKVTIIFTKYVMHFFYMFYIYLLI